MNKSSVNFWRVNCCPVNGAQFAHKGGVIPTPGDYLVLDKGKLDINKLK